MAKRRKNQGPKISPEDRDLHKQILNKYFESQDAARVLKGPLEALTDLMERTQKLKAAEAEVAALEVRLQKYLDRITELTGALNIVRARNSQLEEKLRENDFEFRRLAELDGA
jgi:chromosome segregation ATPase